MSNSHIVLFCSDGSIINESLADEEAYAMIKDTDVFSYIISGILDQHARIGEYPRLSSVTLVHNGSRIYYPMNSCTAGGRVLNYSSEVMCVWRGFDV